MYNYDAKTKIYAKIDTFNYKKKFTNLLQGRECHKKVKRKMINWKKYLQSILQGINISNI